MKKHYNKYFSDSEIESVKPFYYDYESKRKIVTYVPLSHTDKVMFDMSFAGAGVIGNYRICSFRMMGVGTFLPVKGSKPFSGSKGKISYDEEVRLEMECSENLLDDVVEALLKAHPYDEPAYEIYEFVKRGKTPAGYILTLKKTASLKSLITRLNKSIKTAGLNSGPGAKKIAVLKGTLTESTKTRAAEEGCGYILSIKEKNITINKI